MELGRIGISHSFHMINDSNCALCCCCCYKLRKRTLSMTRQFFSESIKKQSDFCIFISQPSHKTINMNLILNCFEREIIYRLAL